MIQGRPIKIFNIQIICDKLQFLFLLTNIISIIASRLQIVTFVPVVDNVMFPLDAERRTNSPKCL